jgi:hypothetical protein
MYCYVRYLAILLLSWFMLALKSVCATDRVLMHAHGTMHSSGL